MINQADYAFADACRAEMLKIASAVMPVYYPPGEYVPAGDLEDLRENTDAIWKRNPMPYLCLRARRSSAYRPREFTIRTRVPSGAPTEIHKMVDDGLGDLMLHAVAAEDARVEWWQLLDLRAFADAIVDRGAHGLEFGRPCRNRDGSEFLAFPEVLPAPIVVAASAPAPRQLPLPLLSA